MTRLRVSLVQSRLRWRDPEQNRAHLSAAMDGADAADLFVLPETFTTGFLGEKADTDEGMDGPTVAWLQHEARARDAAVCGSAVICDDAGRRNRFLFAAPDGQMTFYDKRHLFSYAGEDKRYVAGERRVVFEYLGWRINPQICYDLRFPVWCRSRDDFDLAIFVANWPSPRVNAWDALLRARAMENQCYVVAVNRVGEDGRGLAYPGHSAIYDPLGETVIEPWETEGAKDAVIDLDRVREIRSDFPFAAEADDFTINS
ncbi:MAG: amidohydrolase [Xanthomonadales bacterium]|jgi:predicted amidohydrolase|nr:amidohydrolase [Xanthomonadales bacterium]